MKQPTRQRIEETENIDTEYKLFPDAQWLAIELNKHKPGVAPKHDVQARAMRYIWEKICIGCADASRFEDDETHKHFLQVCYNGIDNWL